jgi:putative spermidine/putrescine transport system substrate-binding protein
MKIKHSALTALAIAGLAALTAGSAFAQTQLTVVNFGGANGNAQKKAYFEPFEKANNAKVVGVEYNGEQAKIKAMVEARKVSWDVVEVESPDVARGCDEGLFEKLDYSKIGNKADFQPAAVTECGIGTFVWSTVMAYNADKLKTAPTTWADFWDTKKFPGKRAMRKGARYNVEFALMADGVKVADVYKVLATKEGAERAFKKLTELKPSIQWWEAGAQPPQFLVAGDVVMTTAYNGRIDAAQREGKNLAITWTGGIYDLDYWAIPKGSPNKDLALKYIALASSPDAQAAYAQNISYGPTNTKALAKLDAKVLAKLPTAPGNARDALQFDVTFWADQGEALEKRFASWAAQ